MNTGFSLRGNVRRTAVALLPTLLFCPMANIEQGAAASPGKPGKKPNQVRAGNAPPAPSTEAMRQLKEMVSAYKRLDCARIPSTAIQTIVIGQSIRAVQTTLLVFQRDPARIALTIEDPVSGTQKLYYDGAALTHYYGVANLYGRFRGTWDLAGLARKIDSTTPQVLSPLQFLMSDGAPAGIESASLSGVATMGGKTVQIIRGAFSRTYLRDLATRLSLKRFSPVDGSFEVWIDPATHFLRKSSVNMSWRGTVGKARGGKPAIVAPRLAAVETFGPVTVNPKPAPEEFKFVPPPGARERSDNP